MGSAAVADVWVDEGYGRVASVVDEGLAMYRVAVSCDDGRLIDVYLDSLYKPRTKAALAVTAAGDLEDGQRVLYRIETVRHSTAPVDVSIRELDDNQVSRTFVTLTVIPDGVDEPAGRPPARTIPVPNVDTPPPARQRRELPFRDTWAYAGEMGCVVHAYKARQHEGLTDNELYQQAKGVLVAADLAQLVLEHRVDRSKYSHTRIRSAVHAIVEEHPLPVEEADDVKKGWLVGVALQAVQLCRMADALHRVPTPTWCDT